MFFGSDFFCGFWHTGRYSLEACRFTRAPSVDHKVFLRGRLKVTKAGSVYANVQCNDEKKHSVADHACARCIVNDKDLGDWRLSVDKLRRTSQGIEESLARVGGLPSRGYATSCLKPLGWLFAVESRNLIAGISGSTMCEDIPRYFPARYPRIHARSAQNIARCNEHRRGGRRQTESTYPLRTRWPDKAKMAPARSS